MPAIKNFPHHLVYFIDSEPGYYRVKCGRGFIYKESDGSKVSDVSVLERIKKLVIPPQWDRVWISPLENGHLQATGFDAKGRKQYIYHPDWRMHRQQFKYDRMVQFGKKLPVIRKKLEEHIRLRGWPKEKILAMIVMLLDEHYIRIGNKHYEIENKTYGLTTLRRKHIARKNGKLYLSYKAKSGKYREVLIESKRMVKLISKISELPGYEVFKYLDDQKKSHRLDSHDVNNYLEEISGEYFTAKDFRTWGGTVLAVEHYDEVLEKIKKNPRLNLETNIVKSVAEELGNTTAICREYYIHPRVIKVLVSREIEKYRETPLNGFKYKSELSKNEQLVLKIIEKVD